LAELAHEIAAVNGSIWSFAAIPAEDPAHRSGILKITGATLDAVKQAVEKAGAKLEDIREC
jgi:hypothetical protein